VKRTILALWTLLLVLGHGQPTATAFKDGDRVALIGDSITHGGAWHAYLYDYYLTRAPKSRIVFYNCGISGDSAAGALSRFDWDVAPKKPNRATIMLGMNDVGRTYYGVENPGADLLARRTNQYLSWRENMAKLTARLVDLKVEVTLITPSPYDQTATLKEKNLYGVNDILAICGETAKAMARAQRFGLVDFNGPFTALNLEVQKTNAEATLVGRDRVHPGDLGHFILAYLFLKSQGRTATVAAVEIDAKGKKASLQENCTVTDLAFPSGGVSYTYLAASLPFPVTGAYASADTLVRWTEDLNRETVKVTGLEDGEYALIMDDAALGTFTAAQLSRGLNLATNLASPAQLQAQAVHKTNWDRGNQERILRGLGQVEMGMRRAGVEPSDGEAALRYCRSNLDRYQEQPNLPNAAYYRSVYSNYILSKPSQAAVVQRVEELLPVLYQVNQPKARRMVIRRP